jgi:hypothetical protein
MQLWSDAELGSRVDADAYRVLGVSAIMVVANSLSRSFAGRDGSTVPAAVCIWNARPSSAPGFGEKNYCSPVPSWPK